MPRVFIRYATLIGLSCLLTACGFALRGTGGTMLPDSWKTMYLASASPNGELSREVEARFAGNGVVWVERSEAPYTVRLGSERFNQRNLSLNSQARASEFELTLQAQFSVIDGDGREAIAPTDAVIVKQMENDPRNVVGKAEEIRILRAEMRTELAQQIIRRIGFYAASTQ